MTYIRKQQMNIYKGKDADKIMISEQVVIEFEIECLLIAIEILERKKKIMNKTTIEFDLAKLEETKAGNKWRWAECIYYRIGQKKLLDMNIEAHKLLVEILKNIQESSSYKAGYMKPCPKYEKDEAEVIENRLLFSGYLKRLAITRKHFLGIPYEN